MNARFPGERRMQFLLPVFFSEFFNFANNSARAKAKIENMEEP